MAPNRIAYSLAALWLPVLSAQLPALGSPETDGDGDSTGHTEVYRNGFETSSGLDCWSKPKTSEAPNGRRFLGTYDTQTALRLTLSDLPKHRFVRLRADLFVLMSLDGVWEMYGPDTWGIMVEGGPLLMLTSFCNHSEFIDLSMAPPENPVFLQNYPDEFPTVTHPVATGESGEGRQLKFPFRPWTKTRDSIYKLDLVFPHSNDELVLRFFSHFTERADDEAWGLDNVVVDVVEHEAQLSEAQFATCWKQIGGKDPVLANRALWRVVAAGETGLADIQRRWRGLMDARQSALDKRTAVLLERFNELRADLENEQFHVRLSAMKEIDRQGLDILPLVEERLGEVLGPEERRGLAEVRARLRLKKLQEPTLDPDRTLRSRVDHLQRIFETHKRGYEISSSLDGDSPLESNCIGAPADGFVPDSSSVACSPHFTWLPRRGTTEWLEYKFSQGQEISRAETYWYVSAPGIWQLPKSWKILYRDEDGEWKPVAAEGHYPIRRDRFNRIEFPPVRTDAVRLVVELKTRRTAGLHEFRVSGGRDE